MNQSLVLLLAITGSALALSCYSYNSNNRQGASVVENKAYCSAIYTISSGSVTFGGSDGDPTTVDAYKNQDCQLRKPSHNENQAEEMYVCYCFQNLCNYPFSWLEFEARNYTLAFQYPEVEDIVFPE